jgi:hypothetical protein
VCWQHLVHFAACIVHSTSTAPALFTSPAEICFVSSSSRLVVKVPYMAPLESFDRGARVEEGKAGSVQPPPSTPKFSFKFFLCVLYKMKARGFMPLGA